MAANDGERKAARPTAAAAFRLELAAAADRELCEGGADWVEARGIGELPCSIAQRALIVMVIVSDN
jgi:hypothetical protein